LKADAQATPLVANGRNTADMSIYNVKDYGARGDDAADDTSAIRSALKALKDKGIGGILFFPAGRYKVSDEILIDAPGVTVQGVGTSSGVGALARGSHIIGTALNKNVLHVSSASSTFDSIHIVDLSVEGNPSGGTGNCIFFEGIGGRVIQRTVIDNVTVSNCAGDGLRLYGATGFEVYDVSINNLTTFHNRGNGMSLDGVPQIVIGKVFCNDNAGQGIDLNHVSALTAGLLTIGRVPAGKWALHISNSYALTVDNLWTESIVNGSIFLDQVRGLVLENAWIQQTGTAYGMLIQNSGTYTRGISINAPMWNNGSSHKRITIGRGYMHYGINLYSHADGPFTANDIECMQNIVNPAEVMFHNARPAAAQAGKH
jgi:hypothetical protein